ncbi:hypothetical protein Mal15_61820 [Stieleria maiorica]|uniref:DUF1559 domain-containing protein n=1 Tax=Stieleria maiorica TaxID=2795974 RepID=A0A5B9MLB2_9BACT|nr:DUF1559 domain-containing protein [Stieleria maiorica]QEG02099.1 hypothetical protein Mal15_61820 [Stieleria maiorica]
MARSKRRLRAIEVIFLGAATAMLVFLLLPAIDAVRRPHRNVHCLNNLKQLGLAAQNFHSQRGRLPGYVRWYGDWRPGPLSPSADPLDVELSSTRAHQKVGTWVVAMLPYLDQQPLYDRWSINKFPIAFAAQGPLTEGRAGIGFNQSIAASIDVLQCPEAAGRTAIPGVNNYACNAGMHAPMMSPHFERSMSAANGVFNNQFPGRDPNGDTVPLGPEIRFDDIADGLSNTLLFTENLQAMPWHRAGFIDAEDLVLREGQEHVSYEPTCRYTQGVVWHRESDDPSSGLPAINPIHRINSTIAGRPIEALEMTKANAHDLARPSSLHPGGVNIALADGSLRFLSETVDYRVYQSLLAPDDARSDAPLDGFELPSWDDPNTRRPR